MHPIKDKKNVIPSFGTMDKVVLELGCGPAKRIENAITVDMLDIEGVDIVCDLDNGLPFLADNSIDEIHSFHFLEHVKDINFMMAEIYRVLKIGGKHSGTVPYFGNPYFYSDPTHKSTFGLYTFSYFSKIPYFKRRVPTFYNNVNFKINDIRILFRSNFFIRRNIKRIFQMIFNSSRYMKELYEEMFCYMIPGYEIFFELEKR